jgi:predicted transcriptional regulator
MRSGIPQEDWAIVATVYDDADAIARFLGNETPLPARVVLLDKQGKVAFFHDRGYSTKTLLRLSAQLQELRKQS